MAHIVGFKIEGLAGRLGKVEINLNPRENIFFGPNGSGKTSLLKILHSAMDCDTSILKKVPFKSAEVEIYSIRYKKTFRRELVKPKLEVADVQSQQSEYSITSLFDHWPRQTAGKEALRWRTVPSLTGNEEPKWHHCYLPTSRLYLGAIEGAVAYPGELRQFKQEMTEDELDRYFAKYLMQLWVQYSSIVLAEVRKAQEQGLAGILEAVLSKEQELKKKKEELLAPELAYDRITAFLQRQGSASIIKDYKAFEKRYLESAVLKDVVQDIDAVEKKIEKATAFRNDLQNLILRMFSGNKKVSFTDRSIEIRSADGQVIGIEALSSGEKHLLDIFINALIAKDCSLLIDEPEISMHIDWQRDLIKSLHVLSPRAQLIIATHSPEIMAHIKEDKIFQLH